MASFPVLDVSTPVDNTHVPAVNHPLSLVSGTGSLAVPDELPWPAPRLAWGMTLLLFTANTLAFADRQVLALFVEPIEHDLHISDTRIGMLYGVSFTLFYVLTALPIARLADRRNRRNLVRVSVLLWSISTSLGGLMRSFGGLAVARMGVGAGEGGLSPVAYSLLADSFPPRRLALPIAIYQAGIYIGGATALLAGGWLSTVIPPATTITLPLLGAARGWQIVFFILGLPGLMIVALLRSVREPARRGSDLPRHGAPIGDISRHFVSRGWAYPGIMLGFALMILVGNGMQVWIPTFFERKFAWSLGEVGGACGTIVLVCGSAGTFAGGWIASRLEQRGVSNGNLKAALIGFVALIPVTIAFPLMPSAFASLVMLGIMNIFAGFNFGGGLAALQAMTPNRMRAQMSAVFILVINLIGAAGGPALIGVTTDYGFADPQRLPSAMALVAAVASPAGAVALWVGIRAAATHGAHELPYRV